MDGDSGTMPRIDLRFDEEESREKINKWISSRLDGIGGGGGGGEGAPLGKRREDNSTHPKKERKIRGWQIR